MKVFPRAFTLIELLVVIAIIAILAVLITPALARSKAEGYRIVCTNNQKQLMLAFLMYEHDSNDYLPWPNWDIEPYAGVKGWLYTGPLLSGYPSQVESGSLWSYLKNRSIYFCPLDIQRTNSNSKPPGSRNSYKTQFLLRNNQMSSFICNGAVSGYGKLSGWDFHNTYQVSRFKPTNYLLWEPDEMVPYWFNDGSSTPAEGFSTRHNEGATLGTFGGQVVYLKYTRWAKQLTAPYPNDFYCSPP